MAHHHRDMLVAKSAAHGEIAACRVVLVGFALVAVRYKLHVANSEKLRIVEQCAVDAAPVWTLDVYVLVATGGKLRLAHKVLEHTGILHLGATHHGTAHAGQFVGAHIGYRLCHVAKFVGVFVAVPLVRTVGKEVVIVLALIVTGVEKVLKIIETYAVNTSYTTAYGTLCHKDEEQ